MGEITQETHFEMLEKLPDGNYKAKYPKVKSKSGVTFDEHLADSVHHPIAVASDMVRAKSLNEIYGTNQEYTTAVEIQMKISGTIRVSFNIKTTAAGACWACIFVNNIAKGTQRHATTTYVTFTEDITVNAGDLIQIKIMRGGYSGTMYLAQTKFCYNAEALTELPIMVMG